MPNRLQSAEEAGPSRKGMEGMPEGNTTSAWIHIHRGRTQFPRRPIPGDRFLIGGSSRCDLQLGGGVPVLHSLIHRDGPHYWIEAVASVPALEVNEERRKTARLSDGDQIRIGSFQFQILIPAVEQAQPANSVSSGSQSGSGCSLQDMTAAELVEQIERETRNIDEFESRQRMGADALMQEIIQRAALAAKTIPHSLATTEKRPSREVAETIATPGDAHLQLPQVTASETDHNSLLNDIERLVDKLQQYEQLLHQRAKRLSEREANCDEAALALSEDQQRLEEQVVRLTEELTRLKESAPADQLPKLRKAV